MCGGILFCVLFVFLLFGLLMAILPLMGVNIELLHLVYCGIGVLIFSIYLIYDTQVQNLLFVCLLPFGRIAASIHFQRAVLAPSEDFPSTDLIFLR